MSSKQSLGDMLCLLRFFLLLLFLLLFFFFFLSFFLSFFRQKFIRHISRRLLNGNQWYFTGMLSLCPPNKVWETLCLLRFLLLLFFFFLSFFLSFFRQKFIQHISRRLLNGNQWNFTGMLSTMSWCADYFRNFQNGRRCHGNGQNAKKMKHTKMIIAGVRSTS
jgi:ABC-type multidrug transport system fused ATPase/permease subunit